MNLEVNDLKEQAHSCAEKAKKTRNRRRDYERDKWLGFSELATFYTIMVEVAKKSVEFTTEVDKLLQEAWAYAESAENLLNRDPFCFAFGYDDAKLATMSARLVRMEL
ncbi:hypothetical protein [Shimazuella kribbensis]|uniref:hypothetical protein n=1 Tax=Shimazuella kribbensis TaxID=139808 RepID=UPI000491CCB9|nr:hypothetical protein [Shimazuella kribbensis]